MRKLIACCSIAVLGATLLSGCSQDSKSYSNDLSSEMPKPREGGPDFGAYKGPSVKPGDGKPASPGSQKGK